MAQDISGEIVQAFLSRYDSPDCAAIREKLNGRPHQEPLPSPHPDFPYAVLRTKPIERDISTGSWFHKELVAVDIYHTDRETLGEIIQLLTKDATSGFDEKELPVDGWMRTQQQTAMIEATKKRKEMQDLHKATVGWIIWIGRDN